MILHPHGLLSSVTRLGIVCGAVLLLLPACRGSGSGGDRPGGTMPLVEAVQARHGKLPLSQRLSGAVRGKNQVDVYPEISAVITDVLVEIGDAVETGQPLVRLDDKDFQQRLKQARASHQIAVAQLRGARAQAKEAKAELERVLSLVEKDFVSQADIGTAEAKAEAADAEVQLAEARVEQAVASAEEEQEHLAQTVIRAPISGRVGNRRAEVGMLAGPGSRLFTLGQLDSVQVEIILTDRMLDYIEEGQRTQIAAAGGTVSAQLSRISPFLDPVSHTTEAEIDMSNPDGFLKPGMFVSVDVFYGESEEATLVPLSALYEHPTTGVVGVYVGRGEIGGLAVDELGSPREMTEPVPFEFVPAEVVAQGRMEAAVRTVKPGEWVVTLGQNLLSGEPPEARVRPVEWERVERLQKLQREDLMESVVERQTIPE